MPAATVPVPPSSKVKSKTRSNEDNIAGAGRRSEGRREPRGHVVEVLRLRELGILRDRRLRREETLGGLLERLGHEAHELDERLLVDALRTQRNELAGVGFLDLDIEAVLPFASAVAVNVSSPTVAVTLA